MRTMMKRKTQMKIRETLKSFKENKSKYPIMTIAIGVEDEWKGI